MKPNKFQLLEALKFFYTVGPHATFKFLTKPRRILITELIPQHCYDNGGSTDSIKFKEVTSTMDKKTYMIMYRDYKNIQKGIPPMDCNLSYIDLPF